MFSRSTGAADDAERATRTRMHVLITGNSSMHRWNVARRIHEDTAGDGPFIVAYHDGPRLFAGIADLPHGATIFIDDVSLLDLRGQDALMDLLDRVGSSASRCRIIAGASASLHDRVVSGDFPAALFYRLNLLHLVLPAAPESVSRDRRRIADPVMCGAA